VFFDIPKNLVVALNATPSVLALTTRQTRDIGFLSLANKVFLVSEKQHPKFAQMNKLRIPLLIVLYLHLIYLLLVRISVVD